MNELKFNVSVTKRLSWKSTKLTLQFLHFQGRARSEANEL